MQSKLLVVEDDEVSIKILTYMLEKDGYVVYTALNGMEAKEMLTKEIPDLIITDLLMPFFSGMELVNYVRTELKSDVPIIVVSRAGHEDSVMKAFDIGADDFVSKPYVPGELQMRIKMQLHK